MLVSELHATVVDTDNLVTGTLRADSFVKSNTLASALYDFAVEGGAVSSIPIDLNRTIPSGSIIIGAIVECTTACTSGGSATITLGVLSSNDILTITNFDAAPFTGTTQYLQKTTTSTILLSTDLTNVDVTIGTAALTAGVFRVYLQYRLPSV